MLSLSPIIKCANQLAGQARVVPLVESKGKQSPPPRHPAVALLCASSALSLLILISRWWGVWKTQSTPPPPLPSLVFKSLIVGRVGQKKQHTEMQLAGTQ